MVWTVHWRIDEKPGINIDVASSRDAALRIAKLKQSIKTVTITKIQGPNGEVLTAEQILPLIKALP